MQIKTFVFNDFRENTYVAYDESGECVFIDAGCYSSREEERVVDFINQSKLKPVALINTHGHIDHILGNAFLCERYSIPSYLHKADLPMLEAGEEQGKAYNFALVPPPKPKFLEDEFAFGNTTLQVLHVPGHSKGCVALYSKERSVIFTGDTLFQGSIGRTDLPGGDYDEIMRSLTQLILPLPDETQVLPGHGYPTTIGSERLTNPFLQPITWTQL
ncbi:MAG: MBL fold metallo-hydrolase [Prevotellaceae bacterium]|jgi:glyoxylase-like metal-dependent hydrolase (beta-lactamase superfamily II)|nr:MBL fold metallo-hydrolase [Prevotellaceae bacterium]